MKKRPGDLPSLGLFGVPAGNTSRKIAYSVCRAYFCARAIAAQWGSAPKAKQKRARRLFFVWYSRWESNPERPLRRGLLYPFNYGSISCYPAGNTSSLRSSCHRKRWGEPGMIFPASMQKQILLFCAGIRRRAWNALYFTTFRAKRQLFSRGKFESTPMLPRSRFLSKNIIQTLDNEAGICIIKLDMIQMVCSESAAAGREGI